MLLKLINRVDALCRSADVVGCTIPPTLSLIHIFLIGIITGNFICLQAYQLCSDLKPSLVIGRLK